MNYTKFKVSNLTRFKRRDIRSDVLEKLKEKIKDNNYNPARPLTVVQQGGKNMVADGNHRLKALQELGVDEVPCVMREGNIYQISIECNDDEDTYAPEDLFDRLDTIAKLKEEGYTQEKSGEVLGVSRSLILNHSQLNENIDTSILKKCKSHQVGRVSVNDTNVTFNFTEGWFRTSGLYDLNELYQQNAIDSFISSSCNWTKRKLQKETSKYKSWQDMERYASDNLYDQSNYDDVAKMVQNGSFANLSQLKNKVDQLNEQAQNKLIQGDSVKVLDEIDDASIDIVITDPPYGMDYSSNRSKYNDAVTSEGMDNDTDEIYEIFEDICSKLDDKTKEDARLYFFCRFNTDTLKRFENIAGKYFKVGNTLIWNKGNTGAGDLNDWGLSSEYIINCSKGNKPLTTRPDHLLSVNRLSSSKMIHPTEKPKELIKKILDVSANKKDMFCDPFMGSGAHVEAAKDAGCNYIGIELDKNKFDKAKARIDYE